MNNTRAFGEHRFGHLFIDIKAATFNAGRADGATSQYALAAEDSRFLVAVLWFHKRQIVYSTHRYLNVVRASLPYLRVAPPVPGVPSLSARPPHPDLLPLPFVLRHLSQERSVNVIPQNHG